MAKRIVIVVCCVVLAAAAAVGLGWFSQNYGDGFVSYPVRKVQPVEKNNVVPVAEDEESVTLQKTDDGPWKVMMFTDLHLDRAEREYAEENTKVEMYTGLDQMVQSIRLEQPDLVLLGGDNVTNGWNHKRTRTLARTLERLGVYWGGVLGNHEGDSFGSYKRENMVKKFASFDHCIMRLGPADIDGVCNYCIHLLNSDGSHAETIFCLDSFSNITDEIRATHVIDEEKEPFYDGAHENQVAWYRAKAEALKSVYGDYRSILLLHIPLPAYDRAAEIGNFLYGAQREPICSTCYENGLFDAIKNVGVTRAVFCGHDHLNNFGAEYEGIVLSYIESSGYGSYGMINKGKPEKDWLQGFTTLTIASDGSYTHSQTRYVELFGLSTETN